MIAFIGFWEEKQEQLGVTEQAPEQETLESVTQS